MFRKIIEELCFIGIAFIGTIISILAVTMLSAFLLGMI